MSSELFSPDGIQSLYAVFQSPITHLDCGKKCAPYNESRRPFCCDTRHAVPTAYQPEWVYLQENTDLWHLWQDDDASDAGDLMRETPEGQVLIACKGYEYCERSFRSITCRAFPFFPYISRERKFLGLSFYWEYADRCWVISNLERVLPAYVHEFVAAFEQLFVIRPSEFDAFHYHSTIMRRVFGRRRQTIPLLHRNGNCYKITPRNGRMRRIFAADFPKYEPYATAARLTFADERIEEGDER